MSGSSRSVSFICLGSWGPRSFPPKLHGLSMGERESPKEAMGTVSRRRGTDMK